MAGVWIVGLCGCRADSAHPGTHCGHCDYRFSYQTPNPCDHCTTGLELPCFGYTPTVWRPSAQDCNSHHFIESVQPVELPAQLPARSVPTPNPLPPPPPAELHNPMSGPSQGNPYLGCRARRFTVLRARCDTWRTDNCRLSALNAVEAAAAEDRRPQCRLSLRERCAT